MFQNKIGYFLSLIVGIERYLCFISVYENIVSGAKTYRNPGDPESFRNMTC